jgi:uncharacterized membrane protein YoaK (UPF0700 family)
MIQQMPKWIWLGGFILSFFAGMINVVSVLSFQHQAVSHMTGSLTQFGIQLSATSWDASLHIFGVLVSFLLGAILSGMIIRDALLAFGKRYGIVLMLEAIFLILSVYLFRNQYYFADYFISAACGLQNAMATTYSGAILRTTHMTGVVTDLGILIGHFFRRLPISLIKLRLYIGLLTGFTFGSILGVKAFQWMHFEALLIPGISLLLGGLLYTSIRLHQEKLT